MKFLYLATKIITYPGAYMKGFWEHFACRMLKIQVTDRRYLVPDASCGHARHEPAMTPAKAYLLALLPYIAQRVLGWLFLGAGFAPIVLFGLRPREVNLVFYCLYIVFLFLGISMLCNSFPAWEDAKRQWRLFYGKPTEEEEIIEEPDPIFMEEDEEDPDIAALDEISEEFWSAECSEEAIAEAAEELSEEPDEPAPPPCGVPRFAGLPAKIILAPCNAWFLAGAWLERWGIPTILAAAAIIARIVTRY